jgi:Holliday junction resolvase RusA-like endonuclease
MATVTSKNKESFDREFMEKRSPTKEKNKPNVKNNFYSKYKDKLKPHDDYFEFVKQNEAHIKSHANEIANKIKTFTGLSEKEKNKKYRDQMGDMKNYVTEAWDYTKNQ